METARPPSRPRRSRVNADCSTSSSKRPERLNAPRPALTVLLAELLNSPELQWWARYLPYPVTCIFAWLFGCWHLVPHLLMGTALRYCVNLAFTALSKMDAVAEPVKIHRSNPPVKQLERELDWDGPLILSPAAFVLVDCITPWLGPEKVVPFSLWSLTVLFLSHYLVVEPIYYVFHLWLHTSEPYRKSHSHHHSSIVTEAVSGTSHPLAESIGYLANFSFPFLVPAWLGCFSYELVYIYFVFFDIMNCIGHCNFETVPRFLQSGPLKYFVYTGTYHSLHHSKFKFNYCLFCPIWDYIGGTVHPTTDDLYEKVLNQPPRQLEAVFLGHGFDSASMLCVPWLSPYLASQSHAFRWWMLPLYPLLLLWLVFCRYFLPTASVQRYHYRGTNCATWCLPVTGHFYLMPSQREAIAKMIEKAVCDADDAGVRYFGLAALNKAHWINHGGADLLPILGNRKIRLVHGNTLTAAAVWKALTGHTKPTDEIFMTGATSKIGRALCVLLARRGNTVRMLTQCEKRYAEIWADAGEHANKLIQVQSLKDGSNHRVWVVGKVMDETELRRYVPLGSLVVDFAVPHIDKGTAAGYNYVNGAALSFNNGDTDLTFCHDMPGTVPACLAATIIHAREEMKDHECGEIEIDEVEKWWLKAEKHGFRLDCLPALH